MDKLAAHRSRSQLPQRLPLIALRSVLRNLLDLIHSHHARSPQALNDDLTAHALLDLLLDLLQNLARQHHHRRRPVSHLGILRSRNVCENACGGMDDVEELHDGRAVVCNGCPAIFVD